MTRNNDKLEELDRWQRKRDLEKARGDARTQLITTICVTATSGVISSIYFIGGFLYHHWSSFAAAVKAYLLAEHGGQ